MITLNELLGLSYDELHRRAVEVGRVEKDDKSVSKFDLRYDILCESGSLEESDKAWYELLGYHVGRQLRNDGLLA